MPKFCIICGSVRKTGTKFCAKCKKPQTRRINPLLLLSGILLLAITIMAMNINIVLGYAVLIIGIYLIATYVKPRYV